MDESPPYSTVSTHLLRLLDTPVRTLEVSRLIRLTHNSLECIPSLADRGRSGLMGDRRVDASNKVTNSLLDKDALGVSCAEEGQVDGQEQKASLGESEEGERQANQERHLQASDESHAGIIVLLDESADGLGNGRLLAGVRGGGLQGGNQVGARVGCNVEDGVDAERQQGQGDLTRVEPHQRHT